MEHNEICKKAEAHVAGLFSASDTSKLIYHNLEHTRKVNAHAHEISDHYNLIENDRVVVCVASWFHDTGYLVTTPEQHEAKSVELMREFMKQENQEEEIVKSIEMCILATRLPVHPNNLLQQIMVDADSYHLGTKDFFITNEQVYQENNLQYGYAGRQDWNLRAIKFLEKHQFYTNFCKENLQERKKKNIRRLKKELKELNTLMPETAKEKGDKKADENMTTKGVQTMLRLTSANHMRLSDMADGKANILISVNAIIISVILSVLLRKLQTDSYLAIPTMIFLTSSVCTIVVAILATRPKVTGGVFSDIDVVNKKTNLLFFGNFYKMSFEIYEKSMKIMMADADYLYSSVIKDIYQLGIVLARKYRLIRLAYYIFMFGIIASVLAFGLAAFLMGSNSSITDAPL